MGRPLQWNKILGSRAVCGCHQQKQSSYGSPREDISSGRHQQEHE